MSLGMMRRKIEWVKKVSKTHIDLVKSTIEMLISTKAQKKMKETKKEK